MRADNKQFNHPGKHKSVRIMWLAGEYRLFYKRDRKRFLKDHPEVLKMSAFDQTYILT